MRAAQGAVLGGLALGAAALPARAETPEAVRTVLFGSLDAGAATFVAAGAKVALDRIDRASLAALVTLGGGLRRERGPPPASGPLGARLPVLVRTTLHGAALGGYQHFLGNGVVAVFVGPEFSTERLTGGGASQALPARLGLRVQGEAWLRPSADTLLTATVILGSARREAWGRVSWGYRLRGAYLGPEAAAYADRSGYTKWSAGLHATDLALGPLRLRLSVGAQIETGRRAAPYATLAAWGAL